MIYIYTTQTIHKNPAGMIYWRVYVCDYDRNQISLYLNIYTATNDWIYIYISLIVDYGMTKATISTKRKSLIGNVQLYGHNNINNCTQLGKKAPVAGQEIMSSVYFFFGVFTHMKINAPLLCLNMCESIEKFGRFWAAEAAKRKHSKWNLCERYVKLLLALMYKCQFQR